MGFYYFIYFLKTMPELAITLPLINDQQTATAMC